MSEQKKSRAIRRIEAKARADKAAGPRTVTSKREVNPQSAEHHRRVCMGR